MTLRASIAGIPLLASSPNRWHQTIGVRPFIAEFDVTPKDAATLDKVDAPSTLRLGKVRVEKVFILYRRPTNDRNIKRIAVADRQGLVAGPADDSPHFAVFWVPENEDSEPLLRHAARPALRTRDDRAGAIDDLRARPLDFL